jgi:hypothetical protein
VVHLKGFSPTWLKQWNKFGMLKKVKKFSKQGFLDAQMVAHGNILAPSNILNHLA